MKSSQLLTITGYGPAAGSARVRVFDWLDETGISALRVMYAGTHNHSPKTLASHSWKVLSAERSLRDLARRVKNMTVLISRQASPFSNGSIERSLLQASGRGVYDFDDALFEMPAPTMYRPWSKSRIWIECVKHASTVIAGNDTLAEYAAKYSRDVRVIPSCVRVEDYPCKQNFVVGDAPSVVWLGSPSTESSLAVAATGLLEAHRRTGVRLKVISSGRQSLGILDPMVDRVSWDKQTFSSHLTSADIGIMPLEDSPWARGKCAYKLLQYAATGLPMIASPVGMNARVLELGKGIAVEKPGDWADALIQAINEGASIRQSRGIAARSMIAAEYSFSRWRNDWLASVGQDLEGETRDRIGPAHAESQ